MNARGMKRLDLALPNDPILFSTSTAQLDISMHERVCVLNRALGVAVAMPKANGSGTYLIVAVGIVPTTTPFYVISTKPSTDIFAGSIGVNIDNSTAKSFMSVAGASGSNTITINGTSTGGATIGDMLVFIDILPGVWLVTADVIGTSSATPFSHV